MSNSNNNSAISNEQRSNEPNLDLGHSFLVNLFQLCRGTESYTIEQLIAALDVTTKLQKLYLMDFVFNESSPEINRRVIEPLCRCLANLRRANNQRHPLRELNLCVCGYWEGETSCNAKQQFLMAAQQGEICHIKIEMLKDLPVEWLVNYCRKHKNLESLSLLKVSLISQKRSHNKNNNNADESDPPSAFTRLKTMSLPNICFGSTRAASIFEQFAEDLRLSSLKLGKIRIIDHNGSGEEEDMDANDFETYMSATDSSDDDDDANDDEREVHAESGDYSELTDLALVGKDTVPDPDDDSGDKNKDEEEDDEPEYENEYDHDYGNHIDSEITGRIVTKLVKPSVEELYLTRLCRKSHFQAALEAVKSLVVNLWVDVRRRKHSKLTLLARMIRGAVKLESLTLRNLARRPWFRFEPAFFQDVAVCTTLTHAQLGLFHSKSAAKLQATVSRNCELARFVANPSTCPIDAMLSLVSQFSDTYCPSGLYLLARGFPAVISFDMIKTKDSSTESKLKKQKVS